MPPTFWLFALFVVGAYVAPVVLLVALVLVARRKTRRAGQRLLLWSLTGALVGFMFASLHRPIFIEDALIATGGGFTVGAEWLLGWVWLRRRLEYWRG